MPWWVAAVLLVCGTAFFVCGFVLIVGRAFYELGYRDGKREQ